MATISTGVRFKVDELEFIKKHRNLKSAQQVIYFLCSEYCKLWRVENQSVFAPQKDIYDSPKLPKDYFKDEYKQYPEPEVIKDYNYYFDKVKDLEEQEECFKFISDVESDNKLATWQKKLLKDRLKAKWQ